MLTITIYFRSKGKPLKDLGRGMTYNIAKFVLFGLIPTAV